MESDEGILKLGVEIARWSVEDVRALHEADIKVIGPLGKAIAAKRGATHRQHCPASRNLDGLQISDEYESEYSPAEIVATSLYTFVIYCNLFHADIEQAYGQLPLDVGLLGSEFRRHWMEYRMFTYEFDGHDVAWSRLDITSDYPQTLRAYFETQPGHEHAGEVERKSRFNLFFRIMNHQGFDTLQFLLPNGALASDLASSICSKVWALPLEQVSNKRVWDSTKLRTRKQIGWFSMAKKNIVDNLVTHKQGNLPVLRSHSKGLLPQDQPADPSFNSTSSPLSPLQLCLLWDSSGSQ